LQGAQHDLRAAKTITKGTEKPEIPKQLNPTPGLPKHKKTAAVLNRNYRTYQEPSLKTETAEALNCPATKQKNEAAIYKLLKTITGTNRRRIPQPQPPQCAPKLPYRKRHSFGFQHHS
jgi:hypothetical protein